MKTLEEFQAERREHYRAKRKAEEPHPNGIECPECQKELWDSDPCVSLMSNPPQKNIHCPECGYRGYRLA